MSSKEDARVVRLPMTVTTRRVGPDLKSWPSPLYISEPLETPRQPPPPCPDRRRDLGGDDGSSIDSRPSTRSRGSSMAETTAGTIMYWCEVYAWELLGLAVAAGALAAIAVLAATLDGRPASVVALAAATGPFTLNALVALLATIGKGAMLSTVGLCMAQLKWSRFTATAAATTRGGGGGSSSSSSSSPLAGAGAARPLSEFCAIDQASRGPVGSLAALPAVLAMPLVLAGALVMVAAGGFDFAVQQLVSLGPRAAAQVAVEAGGRTLVPRAQFFFYHDDATREERISTVFAPGTGLVAAIDNGCSGDRAAIDVAATCPTGNCTFPVFNTLAMCSRCVDIRAQLRRVALEPRPAGKNDNDSSTQVYEVQWIAPGNTTLVQRVVGLSSNGSTLNQTLVVSSSAGTRWPALGWPDNTVAPLGLTIIKFRSRPLAVDAVDAPPIGAWQCGMSPCVRTLAVSVVNGRQRTSVLAEYKNGTQLATWLHQGGGGGGGGGGYSLRPPVVPGEDLDERAAMRTNSSKAAKNGIKHDINKPAPPRLPPDMVDRFEISHPAMLLLTDVLKAFFAGSYELSHQMRMSDDTSLVDLPSGRGPYYLGATRDVPGLMANVSDALTSYFRRRQQIRSSRFPANTTTTNTTTLAAAAVGARRRRVVRGVATTQQVVVSVAWAWLSLPILLVACSAALLAATAVDSSARGAPLWRDSCLPMIFHGLDESRLPAKFRGGKGTRGEMQAVAKRLNVAILRQEDPAWQQQDRLRFVAEEGEIPGFPRSG